MKHLQILEDAGLLTTRKVGREKFHYLNPVPIQMVYERWVSKYTQPWTQAMTIMKHVLEENPMSQKPTHVYQMFIKTTPEKLWQALTDGALTRLYYFGTTVESTWKPGAPYVYRTPDGNPMLDGDVLECDPPKRLVTTFRPVWMENPQVTKVTYEIEPKGPLCKLTLIHEYDAAHPIGDGIIEGWAQILSSMKTLLEVGEALPEPA
jgi:uncharacterized protein YndB with AHSA1/START domain